jgi:transcription initiation factor TFIIE subunit alpha
MILPKEEEFVKLSDNNESRKKLDPALKVILAEIGGDQCVKVATELYNIKSDEITDDQLADICGIKLNIVRKILYVLYGNKLAEFRKVRDKKSGWFIYYWHESFENLKELIILKQKQVLDKLNAKLSYEEDNVFYICENFANGASDNPDNTQVCNNIVTFENAMEENFKCKNCGGNLSHYDNDRIKEFLREKIAILRQNIKTTI